MIISLYGKQLFIKLIASNFFVQMFATAACLKLPHQHINFLMRRNRFFLKYLLTQAIKDLDRLFTKIHQDAFCEK